MIHYHRDLIQGSDEWLQARCGLLTASEMKLILSPKTLKLAKNEKASAHLYELAAQRISQYVEPRYIGDDMLRGQADEIEARTLYAKHFAAVEQVGFVTRDDWGFTLGASPDGLVGDDGMIECKSRRAKYQVETIASQAVPEEYGLQIQTALLVTGRKFCDFISYCGGLPMVVLRVHPDSAVQNAILAAATAFERDMAEVLSLYRMGCEGLARTVPTERRVEMEMFIQ